MRKFLLRVITQYLYLVMLMLTMKNICYSAGFIESYKGIYGKEIVISATQLSLGKNLTLCDSLNILASNPAGVVGDRHANLLVETNFGSLLNKVSISEDRIGYYEETYSFTMGSLALAYYFNRQPFVFGLVYLPEYENNYNDGNINTTGSMYSINLPILFRLKQVNLGLAVKTLMGNLKSHNSKIELSGNSIIVGSKIDIGDVSLACAYHPEAELKITDERGTVKLPNKILFGVRYEFSDESKLYSEIKFYKFDSRTDFLFSLGAQMKIYDNVQLLLGYSYERNYYLETSVLPSLTCGIITEFFNKLQFSVATGYGKENYADPINSKRIYSMDYLLISMSITYKVF
ncbi:MAG: hypothetical protein N2555_06635 [Endomicrobia bacterium]|nr:hypothetical protein [Endomicrobiia bacterium]